MSGPPLADGGVLIDHGLIVSVGDAARLRSEAGREHRIDGVLLPGLVNAHTRLELTDAAPLAAAGPLPAWLDAVAGMTAAWPDERWGRSAHRGVLDSLRAGTTTLFDTVTRGPAVPAAARAGIRGDSYVEVADIDVDVADDVLGQVEHALALPAEGRRVGIGPAAPYRLGTGVLQSLGALAKRSNAPLQMHAAGSEAEVLALREARGPLADRARGAGRRFEWLDGGAPTPVRYLEALGVLQERTSLVHPVRVDAGEARVLARRGVSVVCCPRAGERLQMGFPPLEHFVDSAVPVALGTDSRAIAPDADLFAEAAAWVAGAQQRGMHLWPTRAGPVGLHEAAIRLATVDGARALGWGDRCGILEPGRRADLVGVGVETNATDVFRDLVERGAGRQVLTVLAGVRKARRDSADQPWPPLDDDSWRTDDNS
jgi:cytosine/adenosine deaminase-related metal-dependent hydrolase